MRKTSSHTTYTLQQEFRDFLAHSIGRYRTVSGAKSALRSIRKKLNKRKPKWNWHTDSTSLFSIDFEERKEIAKRLRVVKTTVTLEIIRDNV